MAERHYAERDAAGPWGSAFALLLTLTRLWKLRILAGAVAFALIAVIARMMYPGTYTATEQLLFDPDGLKVFAADSGSTRLDANAEINFVESQMGVLLSERVLSRVLQRECDASAGEAPPANFLRLCADRGGDSAKAIEAMRKLLAVKRAERSFLVDVGATSASPTFAARLAGDWVKAYVDEDVANRAAMAIRLTSELNGRLETIRKTLSDTEAKAESYRSDKNLIRVGDKLLIEQKLTDASAALNAAQNAWESARARLKQLETTPRAATGLGALGDEAETRPLALLLDRRAAAEADLAPLESRLGARNPLLVEARSRVAQVDRDIAAEIKSIRAAAREQFARAAQERDNLSHGVAALSKELTAAREAQIALQALEQSAVANRKLLESFENRAREAAEMGRIDLANLRIASEARAPEPRQFGLGLAVWGAAGFALGLLTSMSLVAFVAIWRSETGAAPARAPEEAPADVASELTDELIRVSDAMRRPPHSGQYVYP